MPRPAPPIWLAQPSRFAMLSKAPARWALSAVLLLLALGFTALWPSAAPDMTRGADEVGDLGLYDGVIAGVRAGGDYYSLLADALRSGGYPLRPFLTFRLPLHAVAQAALPEVAVPLVLWALALGVAMAWWKRLHAALARPAPRLAAMILLGGGMVAFVQPGLAGFHEVWAALLVALALAVRRPGRWIEAVALGLIAMLVRETAALFVLVMGAVALFEGGRREALGWAAAFALFLAALAAHAWAVASVTGPLDPVSPGWRGLLGFGFFVRSLAAATALQALPLTLAAPLVALSLVGWAAWRDPLAIRASLVFAGYAVAIALFARADTFYWALMPAPVFLVGLAFVPDALRDLARASLDRRRVRVQRVSQ